MSTVSDLREALRVAIRARDDAQLEVDEARAELDRALRLELESTGEIPQSDTRTSADGRQRPSSRPGTSEHTGPHVIQRTYRARP